MLEFLENDLGLSIVKLLQQGWWGDLFWYLLYPLHFIGSEMGFLIIMPVIYWSVNKPAGKRLFILALSGTIITGALKGWWQRPRPFHIAPGQIEHITETLEPGLPSGHTIFGTVLGLWIIYHFWKRKTSVYMILFIFFMGISRMVHGMHYPQDVALGWLLGGLFFWAYYKLEPVIVKGFSNHTFRNGVIFSVILWVIAFFMVVLVFEEYETRKSMLSPLGALIGGVGGIFIEERFISFTASVKLKSRMLRGIAGLLLLVALYFLLNLGYYAIFEGNHSITAMAFYTLRYMLLGLIVTYVIPTLFKHLKLLTT